MERSNEFSSFLYQNKRNMYKLFFCILFSCIFEFTIFGQYITLQGRQFKDEHGGDFYPVVCNYLLSLPYVENNGTYDFVIAPSHHYGGSALDEYGPPLSDAINKLFVDFTEIKNMGFNSVRLMAILKKDNDTNKTYPGYQNGFFSWETQYCPVNAEFVDYQFRITRPYSSDLNLQKLLNQYHQVIQKAADAGLYVILVPSGGLDLFKDQSEVDDYQNLLLEFCDSLRYETNLLAWDLINEPFIDDKTDRLKGDVCAWTTQLYNTIHTVDSNHLITIGGCIILDIPEWDPSVLKIDFWSPHVYPPNKPRLPLLLNSALEKVTNDIIWLANNCPIPWIIGEAGFVAEDDDSTHFVWGTEAEQAIYAQQTLDTVRNAGGSGYAWWQFQHVCWYSTPPWTFLQNHNFGSDDYYEDIQSYYQNNFGLLGAGDPPYASLEKPVVDVFQSYLDENNQPPGMGTQPVANNYGLTGTNPNHRLKISGTVVDAETHLPIKDAIVFGKNFLQVLLLDDPTSDDPTILIPRSIENEQYTFTNDSGQFTFIPYDYINPITNEAILELKFTCAGCEQYIVGINRPYNNPPIFYENIDPYDKNGDTIELRRNVFEYEKTINNVVIDIAPPQVNFSAWNKLTLNNVTVVGNGSQGGISDMTARTEIQINIEFDAQRGSDVHIFLSEFFRDCNSLIPYKSGWNNNYQQGYMDSELKIKEIDLNFINEDDKVSVFPNPSTGKMTISIHNTEKPAAYLVLVFNMYGSIINQFKCSEFAKFDLTGYPKGVYTLSAYTDQTFIGSCKIVLY
jgi:hypothetical protein